MERHELRSDAWILHYGNPHPLMMYILFGRSMTKKLMKMDHQTCQVWSCATFGCSQNWRPLCRATNFYTLSAFRLWRVTDFQTLSAFRAMVWPSGRAFQKRASRTILSSGNSNRLHKETGIVSVQAVKHSCHRVFLELNCHTCYNISNMPWQDKIILFQITLWTCRFFSITRQCMQFLGHS